MPTKRLRHPGGVSWITRRANVVGAWTVRVEPENLQIDTFHADGKAHVHDPDDYDRRISVGTVGESEAVYRIMVHLLHNGRIELEDLLRELRKP